MAQANNAFIGKIKAHPLAAFFVFTFAISWTAWFLAPTLGGSNQALVNLIDLIAAFGPALSAILVSAITHPEPSGALKKKRLITFATVFGFTFLLETIALVYFTMNLSLETTISAAIASTIAAYIVSSVYHPKQGVAQLMSGLKRVSPKSIWVWAAFLLPFAWQFTAALIDLGLGGTDLLSFSLNSLFIALLAYPTTFFFGGPLNEEPGWRGFATPRILVKYSPLVTGLVIGVIWTIWHFPLHITQFYGDGPIGFLFRFTYTVPFGIIFTWLYSRSGRNLFACILLHTSINVTSAMFGASSGFIVIPVIILLTVIMVVIDKMYKKPQLSDDEEKQRKVL